MKNAAGPTLHTLEIRVCSHTNYESLGCVGWWRRDPDDDYIRISKHVRVVCARKSQEGVASENRHSTCVRLIYRLHEIAHRNAYINIPGVWSVQSRFCCTLRVLQSVPCGRPLQDAYAHAFSSNIVCACVHTLISRTRACLFARRDARRESERRGAVCRHVARFIFRDTDLRANGGQMRTEDIVHAWV